MKPKTVARLILILLVAWVLTWAALQGFTPSNGA